MEKLETSEIATLTHSCLKGLADACGSSVEAVRANLVMRSISNSGAVFVDNKETPASILVLSLGTYSAAATNACVVSLVHKDDPTNFSVEAMVCRQYAKDSGCKLIAGGDFSGEQFDKFWENFNTHKTDNIKIHNL